MTRLERYNHVLGDTQKQIRRASLTDIEKLSRRAAFRNINGQLTSKLYNVYKEKLRILRMEALYASN